MRAIPREVSDSPSVRDERDAYVLGLWCADSYWWSSSIGVSNVEPELILRFAGYLMDVVGGQRLRLRIYEVPGSPPDDRIVALTDRCSIRPAVKMRRTAYHLYVNSRPLLRRFRASRELIPTLPPGFIAPYLAGRFDGDGAYGSGKLPGLRIAYTEEEEAAIDVSLLGRVGVERCSVLRYEKAGEYCIYVQKADAMRFEKLIRPYSWKASCRLTL